MKKILIFIIGLIFCISCTNTPTQLRYKTEYWVVKQIDTTQIYYPHIHQYLPRFKALIQYADTSMWITVHNNEVKLGDTIKIYRKLEQE